MKSQNIKSHSKIHINSMIHNSYKNTGFKIGQVIKNTGHQKCENILNSDFFLSLKTNVKLHFWWDAEVSEDLDLLVQVCLITAGAKLGTTVSLQELNLTPLQDHEKY